MKGLPNVNVKWSHHDARAAQQIKYRHEVKHALHIVSVCLFGPGNLNLRSLSCSTAQTCSNVIRTTLQLRDDTFSKNEVNRQQQKQQSKLPVWQDCGQAS